MARTLSTSVTRRIVVAGLALTAAPVTLAGPDNAYAQAKQICKMAMSFPLLLRSGIRSATWRTTNPP